MIIICCWPPLSEAEPLSHRDSKRFILLLFLDGNSIPAIAPRLALDGGWRTELRWGNYHFSETADDDGDGDGGKENSLWRRWKSGSS